MKSSIFQVVHNRTLGVTALQSAIFLSTVISWASPLYTFFACRSPGGFPGPHLGGLQAHTQGVFRPMPGGGLQAHTQGVSQHALRQIPPADGYCCRWYASYWNAFLLCIFLSAFKFQACCLATCNAKINLHSSDKSPHT